jgi:hypothetical protein
VRGVRKKFLKRSRKAQKHFGFHRAGAMGWVKIGLRKIG